MKTLKRILSVFIILAVITPTTVLAGNLVNTNNTQGGGKLPPSDGGSGVLGSTTAIINMQLVNNTVGESERLKIAQHNKTNTTKLWSECGVSLTDAYLYDFPEFLVETAMTTRSGIITLDTSDRADGNKNYYFVDGSSNISAKPFANHYSIKRNSGNHSSYKPEVIADYIRNDAGLWANFKAKKLTVLQVQQILAIRGTQLQSSTMNFVNLFQNTADVGDCLNSMFDSDDYYENMLTYLDYLLVINEVSSKSNNSTNWKIITNFLKTLNEDGSDKFSVVFIGAGQQYGEVGEKKPVYTMPTYYAVATGKSVTNYMSSMGLNTTRIAAVDQVSSTLSYDQNPAGWIAEVHKNMNAVSGNNAASGRSRMWGGNRDLQWYTSAQFNYSGFTNYKTGFMAMPTDMFGRPTGNTGYTFFSTDNIPVDTPLASPKGFFVLSTKTDTNKVSANSVVSATSQLSLKQSSTNIKVFKQWYDVAKANDLTKATMVIQLGMTSVAGSGTSTKPFDSASGLTTGSLSGTRLTITNLDYSAVYKYLSGQRIIKVNDTGITITGDTTNKYTASITLSFPDDDENLMGEVKFVAKGKTIDSTYVASDKVSWYVSSEPVGSTGSYYSMPTEAFAEVKEGSPGNETFEAMSGVPTTENLYVGFGASEFITNMDVQESLSSGTRTYTLTYTCTNYIGTNERCTITCAGHSTSTSEKEWVEATYKAGPPDKDGKPTQVLDVAAHWRYYTGSVTLKYGETYTSTTGASYSGTSLCPNNKGGCTWHNGGNGCVHNNVPNQAHPITVTYTATITQPIASFNYLNIVGMELWQLSKLQFDGNPELFTNPTQTLTMPTGYSLYYNQGGYLPGNGRLIFNWSFNTNDKYGNTSASSSNGAQMLATQCDAAATAWFNSMVSGATVKATVVSDYAVLSTTEGYQTMAYHTYDSDTVPLNVTFSTGSTSKSATASTITFGSKPTWDTLWTNNPNASANWTDTGIARSGYNGNYSAPNEKYNNANVVTSINPASALGAHPNLVYKAGTTAFRTGLANMTMVRTGLNIIDSTNTITKEWDASDSILPITNGEWETGTGYVEATKVVTFGTTGGIDHATEADGTTWRQEVGYTTEKLDINNIVIHNPTSAQYATVISNDPKYDNRTETSLLEGGDPGGATGEVDLGNGQVVSTNDIFINLDREFQVYFPDLGDFAQDPSLHGLLDTTYVRGRGYTNGMNTTKWVRDKFVIFTVDVLDSTGKSWLANSVIPLDTLPNTNGFYTFYCVLGNYESANSRVRFVSISSNADEIDYFVDNTEPTNSYRDISTYEAYYTGLKNQYIDVVGSIGSLTINDTGDFRFANLFKQADGSGEWLIENLVPKVNYKLPNKIVTDIKDVRGDVASESTVWHGTYGATYASSGGKAYPYVSLPLTPADNNIVSLRNQPLRPGYNLYMDVETIGSYYGENRNPATNEHQDSSLYYKMQITPRYWRLDLNTGTYTPVDVYMGKKGEYTPVVYFDDGGAYASEYYMYLDWQKESARRNYTATEQMTSGFALQMLTGGNSVPARVPNSGSRKDVIGTAARLFLNDLNRTFIGSEFTYGVDKNPEDIFSNWLYRLQGQRWHFTLGLPSSAVFVEAGQPCTDENIKSLESGSAIIVCAVDIKVKGNVWTLEYDGTGVNNSDGGGFRVVEGGRLYNPPIDPETGLTLTDPIIAAYSIKFTSADDLRTEGSH